MKITRSYVLIAALVFATTTLQAQVRDADSMIQKVFASLQAKDQKAFVALYPSGQQFSRFMRNIMEQTLKSDEMKKMMEADEKSKGMNVDSLIESQVALLSTPESMAKMQQEFGNVFQRIIEKGEKKGVKWNAAKLTSYTMDTSAVEGDAPFQPAGLKEAKGVIDFTVGNDAYQLAYAKMMYLQSEGGWFGADFPQLARKGESLEPDAEQADEEVAPAPKKKGPAPKGKAPAKKGKTGSTKAPVRKKA